MLIVKLIDVCVFGTPYLQGILLIQAIELVKNGRVRYYAWSTKYVRS